jgi:hypothetical protein
MHTTSEAGRLKRVLGLWDLVSRGLNPYIGFLAGWATVLDHAHDSHREHHLSVAHT